MIKIQIVSDLHLEFRGEKFKNLIKPSAPILLLLGDICVCGTESDWNTYKKFIQFISPYFKYIMHVPGNHEYYTSNRNISFENTIQGIDQKLKKFAKTIPNLYVLNNDTVKLKIENRNYVFIGTTLWTNVLQENRKYIQSLMNDYSMIWVNNEKPDKLINMSNWKPYRKYNIIDMTNLHNKAVKYISNVLKKIKSDEIVILLTHHKPIKESSIDDIHSQAYESDLIKYIIKKPVRVAAHGHTHVRMDKIVNDVRIVSNPKGYPMENTLYKNDWIITI